jgi:hypothetical protein
MKYTYRLESLYLGEWRIIVRDTRDFCLGYLTACQYNAPRNAMRLLRSDGKVVAERHAATEVSVGQVASYPTPEQYEAAAARAIEQAARIRKIDEQQAARRNNL